MGLSETMVFYLLVGVAVAAAVWLGDNARPYQRTFRTITAVVFWPLYLPMLLTRVPDNTALQFDSPAPLSDAPPPDELTAKIAEVERELDAAFFSLDDWAEDAWSRERDRIIELRSVWNSQAARIREMDAVLAGTQPVAQVDAESARASDPIDASEQARRNNFARLHRVRERAYHDLTATLARVRELVSLIHLARFTGAPASRAEQLVLEIAASVESLSEVAAWRDVPDAEHPWRAADKPEPPAETLQTVR